MFVSVILEIENFSGVVNVNVVDLISAETAGVDFLIKKFLPNGYIPQG